MIENIIENRIKLAVAAVQRHVIFHTCFLVPEMIQSYLKIYTFNLFLKAT